MVSIPACHAGDPGSIPGSGEAFCFCRFISCILCYGEVTWNLELLWLTPSRLQVQCCFGQFSVFLKNECSVISQSRRTGHFHQQVVKWHMGPANRKIQNNGKVNWYFRKPFDENELNNGWENKLRKFCMCLKNNYILASIHWMVFGVVSWLGM